MTEKVAKPKVTKEKEPSRALFPYLGSDLRDDLLRIMEDTKQWTIEKANPNRITNGEISIEFIEDKNGGLMILRASGQPLPFRFRSDGYKHIRAMQNVYHAAGMANFDKLAVLIKLRAPLP